MVTHVTDVKPLASVLTYLDEDSNTEVYQEVRLAAVYMCFCQRLNCVDSTEVYQRVRSAAGCAHFDAVLC
jgi:hypothetical protein